MNTKTIAKLWLALLAMFMLGFVEYLLWLAGWWVALFFHGVPLVLCITIWALDQLSPDVHE